MPAAIPEDVCAALVAAIRLAMSRDEPMPSRNSFARQFGLAAATVTKIAHGAGLAHAFDRSQTKKATEATIRDNAALRAEIAGRLLDVAKDCLDDMGKPHLSFNFGGKDNTYNEHLHDRPDVRSRQALATTAAIALDKHVMLHKLDADPALGEVLSLLERMAGTAMEAFGDGSAQVEG